MPPTMSLSPVKPEVGGVPAGSPPKQKQIDPTPKPAYTAPVPQKAQMPSQP